MIRMTALIPFTITTMLVGALCLVGCTEKATPSTDSTSDDTGMVEEMMPGTLFSPDAPEKVSSLSEAKTTSAVGDEVTFEARIGGRVEPFLAERAVFFVADSSLKTCSELHGDGCKTPWDYCCEPKDNLLRHMATVQVVDAAGQPLKMSLLDKHGLTPEARVMITGTVAEVDEAGTFVINASSIHVQG
jgi:hypothetical protein